MASVHVHVVAAAIMLLVRRLCLVLTLSSKQLLKVELKKNVDDEYHIKVLFTR